MFSKTRQTQIKLHIYSDKNIKTSLKHTHTHIKLLSLVDVSVGLLYTQVFTCANIHVIPACELNFGEFYSDQQMLFMCYVIPFFVFNCHTLHRYVIHFF